MTAASVPPADRSAAVRASRWTLAVVAAVFLLSLPLWAGGGTMRLIVEFSYYLALAQCWNLLAGYSGIVSVGQQAYLGIGAYTFLAATIFAGVPPLLALPLGGLVAACIAVPGAFLMFRLQGAYLAIGTWALAEVFRTFFTQVRFFGAGTGLSLPIDIIRSISADRATRDLIIYYIGIAIGVGSVAVIFALLRSRAGLALTAVRDSEPAAASVGINRGRLKLIVYVIAALIAGLVGGLVVMQKLRMTPGAAFNVLDWSANVIFIVVIGGIGTVEGPIVGAIVFFGLRSLLADYGTWYLVTLGVLAILVMIRTPNGIWGYVVERFDYHLFPVRRRAHRDG